MSAKNVKRRIGQTSIESLMIMAIGIFILAALVTMVYEQMNYGYAQQQQNTAELAVRALAKEVDDAYFLGPGTVRSITLPMPEGVDLNKSFISGRAIILSVAGTDHTASTKIDVRGIWPNTTGSFNFVITSFNDFVHVSVTKASFVPASISETVIQSQSKSAGVLFTNYSQESITYDMSINFPVSGSGAVVSSIDAGEITLNADENVLLNFEISCGSDSFGSYSGIVNFAPVAGANTPLSFPVNVFCASSQKKLGLYPVDKNIYAQVSLNSSDSVIICNNSTSDFASALISISGAASNYVFPKSIGDLPKNSCKTLELNLIPPASTGTYGGILRVQSAGLDAMSEINFIVVENLVPSTVVFDWSSAIVSEDGFSIADGNVFNNDSNILVDKVLFLSSNDLEDSNMTHMYLNGVDLLPPSSSIPAGIWADVDDFNFIFNTSRILDMNFDGNIKNDSEKFKAGFLSKGGAYYWSGIFDPMNSVIDNSENNFSSAIGAEDFNVSSSAGGLLLLQDAGVYSLDGNFYSREFDLLGSAEFDSIAWAKSFEGGGSESDTNINIFVRSSILGAVWSDWFNAGNTSPVVLSVPNGRYVQYLAVLNTVDSNISPILIDVNISYTRVVS